MLSFDHKWPGILLWPLSLLYALVTLVRNLGYDWGIFRIHKVNPKVISIGNITVGGTGKTPTTLFLAQWLKDRGESVVILSRGYGRSSSGPVIVSDGHTIMATVSESGDEPQLLARRLQGVPVVVDEDRVRGARLAESHFCPSVILLDDGFQHRRLHRDLDILLFKKPPIFGNGFLLPAGPLRESKRSVNRAQVYWNNFSASQEHWPLSDSGKPFIKASIRARSVYTFEEQSVDLSGQKVFACCGIAQPKSFEQTVAALNADIVGFKAFSDHHNYTEEDIKEIESIRKDSGANYVVTTEKDFVKLAQFPRLNNNWCYVVIDIDPLNPEKLTNITQYLK